MRYINYDVYEVIPEDVQADMMVMKLCNPERCPRIAAFMKCDLYPGEYGCDLSVEAKAFYSACDDANRLVTEAYRNV